MAKIIKAVCVTASADDAMGRVRLKSEGVWNQETELVPSVNGCALNKGDVVFVSVADGLYSPLVLGKADRNDIVLNLLVDRLNASEDKINELVNKYNDLITKLAGAGKVAEGSLWVAAGDTFAPMLAQPLQSLPTKTKLKDIQDNYK
jgi:hypothetical protein